MEDAQRSLPRQRVNPTFEGISLPAVPAAPRSLAADLKSLLSNLRNCLDLRATLARLHQDLKSLLGAEEALFFLVHESGRALRLRRYNDDFSLAGEIRDFAPSHPLVRRLREREGLMPVSMRWPALIPVHHVHPPPAGPAHLLPMRHRGRLFGIWAARGVPASVATPEVTALLAQIGQEAAALIARRRKWRKLRREANENAVLLAISRKVGASLNLNRVLQTIIDSLRDVLICDHATIFLIDHRTGAIQYEVFSGIDEQLLNTLHLNVGKGISGWVAKKGRSIIIPDVHKDPRYVEASPATQSEMAVPLKVGNKVIGVFNLESNKLNAFSRRDVRLLEAFASQAAMAIQKAQLHTLALKKREYDKELHVARDIQRALLPKAMPTAKGFALAGLNISSHRVGGDFYDATKMADGSITIAIGDVSGKGTPGAILMATLFAIYRSHLRRGQAVNKILERVNKEFRRNIPTNSFATFFLADIDQKTLSIEFANAGHNPPVLMHQNGTAELLHATGTILGFLDDAGYQLQRRQLRRGDILVLYTDGVTEAQDARGQLFGERRLISALRQHRHRRLRDLKWKVVDAVRRFNTGAPLADDLTMLVVKVG